MTDTVESPAQRNARLAQAPWDHRGGDSSFLAAAADVVRRRDLLVRLTRRELKAKYKDSALGFLWVLVRPLTQLAIYYLVVGEFLGAARSIEHFAVYIFAGLTIYTLIAEAISTSTGTIVANSGLIKKIYLPREIFPISGALTSVVNFAIQLVILIAAALLSGTLTLGWHLLYAPAAIVVAFIYATALSLILSAINVYLRDVQYLVEVLVMLLMWTSPIVYSWKHVREVLPPWLLEIYLDNPITLVVIAFQQAFWSAGDPSESIPALGMRLLVAGVIGVLLVVVAQRIFGRLQGDFAQEL